MRSLIILMGYQKNGVKGIFENLKDKKTAKKDAKKELKKEYNDLHFECGYLSSKLDYIAEGLCLKMLVDKKENRLELADMLEEVAEELRNI